MGLSLIGHLSDFLTRPVTVSHQWRFVGQSSNWGVNQHLGRLVVVCGISERRTQQIHIPHVRLSSFLHIQISTILSNHKNVRAFFVIRHLHRILMRCFLSFFCVSHRILFWGTSQPETIEFPSTWIDKPRRAVSFGEAPQLSIIHYHINWGVPQLINHGLLIQGIINEHPGFINANSNQ